MRLPHIHLHGNSPANKPAYIRPNTLQPFNFCFDDFHATLPNSLSSRPLIFHPKNSVSSFSPLLLFILLRTHHPLSSNYKAFPK